MASLCGRTIFQVSRRTFSRAAVLRQKGFPDPLELATGLEKQELLARQAGNDDPFMMKPLRRGIGTKDQPNLVPSAFESRMIGCVCEEDSTHVTWMWLHEGQPRRCECGHWFKIERKQPIIIPEEYMD
ncbi:cytochrome c oxidase subunit 5B, mitochondrial [Diachasma alloeum]|uniref:Polypeptide VB, cytochrome c oxidase n=1 Tax=Diachasma alloeum TaxID=454923 RepID=A0A4E0RN41_9HYME|nr:cytochrome c oxidase subunit 5B, mitochondrial [Diachasma alloeum]THK33208.1 polypeptide VB, cytochrome c oxidase [Diachasma alloeum]